MSGADKSSTNMFDHLTLEDRSTESQPISKTTPQNAFISKQGSICWSEEMLYIML